ncbi:hypothetical protein FACS189429_6490 [Bacteroidia bacterium]|nr:hypothetical protein FACS189429_6490 [Bacteroidia bacterium]GHV45031.1 hypothetical protein FACS1894180_7110 [Bacteroidia bacterium]
MDMIIKAMESESEMMYMLRGEKGYEIVNKYADLPTDTVLLTDRIFECYIDKKDISYLEKFKQGISNLLLDKETIYLVPYYLGSYLYNCKRLEINIYDLKELFQKLSFAIFLNEDYLKNNKNWIGWQYEKGQLGDIIRNIKNMEDEFDIEINYPA